MYKIQLPNFEGPFDLLLYFIKRDEINIYDIPISKITEEFLHYTRIMNIFDLELAGEFLVMASTLMYIKTQMLLPRYKSDDEVEVEDPRTQLVQRLLEYKLYKDATVEMKEKAESQRYVYYRNLFDADYANSGQGAFTKSSLFDLMKAFQAVLNRTPAEEYMHEVKIATVTVEEKRAEIMSLLRRNKRLSFHELIANSTRFELIISFLSILDLLKLQQIYVTQSEVFDDIIIVLAPILN